MLTSEIFTWMRTEFFRRRSVILPEKRCFYDAKISPDVQADIEKIMAQGMGPQDVLDEAKEVVIPHYTSLADGPKPVTNYFREWLVTIYLVKVIDFPGPVWQTAQGQCSGGGFLQALQWQSHWQMHVSNFLFS